MQMIRRDILVWVRKWEQAMGSTACAGTGKNWNDGRTTILLVIKLEGAWRPSRKGSPLIGSNIALMEVSHGSDSLPKYGCICISSDEE